MSSSRVRLGSVLLPLSLAACADVTQSPPTAYDFAPSLQSSVSTASVPSRTNDWGGEWIQMADSELWAHLVEQDSVARVGFKAPGSARGVWRGSILVQPSLKSDAIRSLRYIPGLELLAIDTLLPRADVKVQTIEALRVLRRLGFVDYVEPRLVKVRYHDGSSGCGYGSYGGNRSLTSFAGDILPPLYQHHAVNVVNAWNRTRGDGVVLGLLDTGIASTQDHLVSRFAEGHSAGRWRSYDGVGGHPWYETDCSHGTRMAGAMVSPMNGADAVGVAWRANFASAHQSNRVFDVDAHDVAAGIRSVVTANSAIAPSRRIVTMAFNSDNVLSAVSDEIRYWYSSGVLFVGAAGTFDSRGIAFPARMDEVIAVSGVDSNYQEIGTLNYGSEVDLSFFVGQMSEGRYPSQLSNLDGSSGATAIVSGIAALVWAHYPSESNLQIRNRLLRAGHQYPSHDRVRGYGVVNAMRAVGGLWSAGAGATIVSGGEYGELTVYEAAAHPLGGEGPYTYLWSTGETTRTIRVNMYPGEASKTRTVTVTEPDAYGTSTVRGSVTIDPISPPPGGCADPQQVICG